ncbi:hypothetical protein F5Y15DRAFT_429285 [Xylariaceae sp. FL0016]|nr:hypothetical protein F5Y15DRAFT_429285 [Xylariaceae sp. FL0016]
MAKGSVAKEPSGKNSGPKSWTSDQNVRFLMFLLTLDNPTLSFKGWKNLAAQSKDVFGTAFTEPSMKQQFGKLRKDYLAAVQGTSADPEAQANANDGKGNAATTSKKRKAPAIKAEDDDEDGNAGNIEDYNDLVDDTVKKAKKPRGRYAKKPVPVVKTKTEDEEKEAAEKPSKAKNGGKDKAQAGDHSATQSNAGDD